MSFSILNNALALNARHSLDKNETKIASTFQHLASGSRITSASDDPAGLAIADSLNAQVRSLGAATRNTQEAINLVQTHEGGTNEINNMLVRVRELAIQSASDTVGDDERSLISQESSQILAEVTRIAKSTKFNGRELLSGDNLNLEFQVGTGNNEDTDRIRFNPGVTDLTASGLGVKGIELTDKGSAQSSLETIDSAIDQVNQMRARVGATQTRLATAISAQQNLTENLSAGESQIRDADIAEETSKLASQTILRQAGGSVLAQANAAPQLALKLLVG